MNVKTSKNAEIVSYIFRVSTYKNIASRQTFSKSRNSSLFIRLKP